MQIVAYLNFKGDCEAAFKQYEKILGGQIEAMLPYAGTPVAEFVDAGWRDKIMHARMKVGDNLLMATDAPPDRYQAPQGISISLQFNDVTETERVFKALAEGGQITMPLDQPFWSRRFGALVDRFGIPWMLNCE